MGDNGEQRKLLLTISIDNKNNTFISGPLQQKKLCIKHLCEAIQIISNFSPSKIIKPGMGKKPGILNHLRRRK